MYLVYGENITSGVVMMVESSQFHAEYTLAMQLIGEKAYCWKRSENTFEVGRRVKINGEAGMGYDVWGAGSSWEAAFAQVKERYERENKPLKKVQGKKMNTVRVKNPKHDGYVVYLHPRQGFSLELDLPSDITEDDDWQVQVYGEHFAQPSSGFIDGKKIYEFIQLFDLSSWAKISSVQIAEISIFWKGAKRPGFENRKIFVVLQGDGPEQRDIITLVNPACTQVRISPHQVLEVVVFDNETTPHKYVDYIDFCVDTNKPYLEIEKIGIKKVVYFLENGVYRNLRSYPDYIVNRDVFSVPVNPKITNQLSINPIRKTPSGLYQATHFFYRMARHCIHDVRKLNNGTYKASDVIICDNQNESNAEYSLDVCIGVKGSLKPKLRNFGLSKIQQMLIRENSLNDDSDVGKRVLAKEHFHEREVLLLNPENDNVEFVSGDGNCLFIEIAPPYLFNSKCPIDLEWEVTVDPVWQYRYQNDPQIRLTVTALSKRYFSGTSIQRFSVTPTNNSNRNNVVGKFQFLGIVKFNVPNLKHMTRCVSFYMVASNKVFKNNEFKYPSTYEYRPTNHYPPVPVAPKRTVVKFHEFRTNDLIVNGVHAEKFNDIKIEDDTTIKSKKKNYNGITSSEK